MIRRRRRPLREISFSFDSFLDLIANVIGIILRFILVAWVGARAYKGDQLPPPPPPPEMTTPEETPAYPDVKDPLSDELVEQRQLLRDAQTRLEEQMALWEKTHSRRKVAEEALSPLREQYAFLTAAQARARQDLGKLDQSSLALSASLEQVKSRSQALNEQITSLESAPVNGKQLQYRTPISRPLLSEEAFFECRQGRVTVIDVSALLDQVRLELPRLSDRLRTDWNVESATAAVGAFRLRYTLERKRDLISDIARSSTPDEKASFSYGLSRWEADPVQEVRGETAAEAIREGSAFRKVMNRLNPELTAITFWVYPDSFALYRQLRNDLHDQGFVVAGRPLPTGAPIAASRSGTASRGQ